MRTVHRLTSSIVAIAIALPLVGCTSAEESSEQAREAIAQSIAQGDRQAALEAIDDLRDASEDTADAQLELARLLVQAGNAPEAGWLLEEATRRHPERADLTLALAGCKTVAEVGRESLIHVDEI